MYLLQIKSPSVVVNENPSFMVIFNSYCSAGVNCSTPPVKPGAGTWAWDGNYDYGTNISYTCGPYGNFQAVLFPFFS